MSTMPGEQVGEVFAGGMGPETIHFLEACIRDTPVMVTPESARMVMETYSAADLSADRGEPVSLPLTNETVAAGMIRQAQTGRGHKGPVSATERESRLGHPALAICLPTGSRDMAHELERILFDRGCAPVVLDRADAPAPALRALAEAGLIAIVVGGDASQVAAGIGDILPPDCIFSADPDDSASTLRKKLIAAGKLDTRSQPFREGEGI